MESRGNLRVLTSPTQVGKVGKTPHLAWRLKMKSDGNARFLTSGRGGTGRRAGFRFQYRKMWGFESLRPHQTTANAAGRAPKRSEEHTSELQSLMRISYAVFCLKKNIQT